MRGLISGAVLLAGLAFPLARAAQAPGGSAEPDHFFREYVGLSGDQIRDIHDGKAVAKIVDSPTADQVFVFGSVYVRSTPARYLKMAEDIDTLRKLPNYLAIQKFSTPPKLSDLAGFTLEPDDVKQLKDCKPGHCEIQLPAESMEEFRKEVDWSAPDAADQANLAARKMVLDALTRYQQGGNAALGAYEDKKHPAAVADSFASLIDQSKALPVYLPELRTYLLDYPKADAANIESGFYWEKVNFGLKPTLRVVQAIVFQGTSAGDPAYAVAVKQIYASHYFQAALDLTVCVKDAQDTEGKGFYLITLKGSQQAGLTGFKGSIVRKVAVDKTRSSLEKALASIKQRLEAPPDQPAAQKGE